VARHRRAADRHGLGDRADRARLGGDQVEDPPAVRVAERLERIAGGAMMGSPFGNDPVTVTDG
jgi:hypothetical protein